ncbi:MAG TPA: sulfur carrier protein ThiS [Polyangiaceae bacterium]|nr:sulfur carrier protein ThiS [Polyangiaceae bacterium]
MIITVNGSRRDVPDAITVTELVAHLQIAEGPVAVEINGAVVPRAQHASRHVGEGDVVEVVHFVGGG